MADSDRSILLSPPSPTRGEDRDPTRGVSARHSSANDDHLTPLHVVDRARVVLFGARSLPPSEWRCGREPLSSDGRHGDTYSGPHPRERSGFLCARDPNHDGPCDASPDAAVLSALDELNALGEIGAGFEIGSLFPSNDACECVFCRHATLVEELCGRTFDFDPATDVETNREIRALRYRTVRSMGDTLGTCSWDFGPRSSTVFLNPPGGKTANGNRSQAKLFWRKLARLYAAKNVDCAFFVGFSLEALQSTQVEEPEDRYTMRPATPTTDSVGFGRPAIPLEFPICYPSRRVKYDRRVRLPNIDTPDDDPGILQRVSGESPPHASFFCLLPSRALASSTATAATRLALDGRGDRGPRVSSHPQVQRFVEIFGELGHVVVPERWI